MSLKRPLLARSGQVNWAEGLLRESSGHVALPPFARYWHRPAGLRHNSYSLPL